MALENLLVEHKGRVCVITFNRHDVRNALVAEMVAELEATLIAARDSTAVGAIILTGAGSAFCSGGNLRGFDEQARSGNLSLMQESANRSTRIYQLIPTLGKPLIAAVNGYALGGGCGLAMACDMIIASEEKAVFGYPEITRGFPPALVTATAARTLSRKRVFEMMLTGARYSARQAEQLGFVNRVVPHERLMEETLAFAEPMANYSPSAVKITRDLIFQMEDMEYEKALLVGRDWSAFMRLGSDFAAGASAFVQKKGHKATLDEK